MSEDEGPGTPLGRLKALADYTIKHGLCNGTEAKPSELFLIDEIERLQADLEAEKLAGVQPLVDAIRLQEMYHEEAERLRNELAKARFQPNNRKLTRDIIRALILEIRTLKLELMQAQLMQVKNDR